MAVEVIMPQMGESIFEGTITKWLKKPGDAIDRDEPLFEISTDKVDAEIPSPAAGVLKEIRVEEGKTVPIQTVVALIEASGGAAGAQAAKSAPARPTEAPAKPAPPEKAQSPLPSVSKSSAPAAEQSRVEASRPAPAAPPASAEDSEEEETVTSDGKRIRSSPLVRRLARENGIDLGKIGGTGAGGRISKRDVLAAISAAQQPPASAPQSVKTSGAPQAAPAPAALETALPRERIYFGRYEVQPMSVMRQRIAEHMVLSKRVSPHVYSIDEADMTAIAQVREAARAEF